DWLAAELEVSPIICVLDDLQWGDVPTTRFIDTALRNLAHRPLLIIATARPEMSEVFPDLWSATGVDHLFVRPLSEQASALIAQRYLLGSVSQDTIDRIVTRAEGNPFYLEELSRAAASGRLSETPDTVLATVSIRLAELSPEARRALRAASVFGRSFWLAGVAALLAVADTRANDLIAELQSAGLVAPSRGARFAATTEFHFDHDLVREAAYATLTERDRIAAHRGAGEWLERIGESEPRILAEHFRRGQSARRAMPWFARAAERALEGEDLAAVVECAERAVVCGAKGHNLGALRLLQAEALNWKAEYSAAIERAEEALNLLEPGTPNWAHAAHHISWAASHAGHHERVVAIAKLLVSHLPEQP
ncbi:MAG: serine/threonine-protein kinase PknK, partial [Myxococcota bacterium]